MSNICSHNVKLSGLAENLEKFYNRIKDLRSQTTGISWPFLINQSLYEIIFESEVDIEDWGSDWTTFHSKNYEDGYFCMEFSCESEIEPSFSFWQKVSKEFDLVIEISYFDLDMEFFYTIIFSDGYIVNSEKISNLEYLYYNDRDVFWRECYDEKWESVEEILGKLKTVSLYFADDELNKIQQIFLNR